MLFHQTLNIFTFLAILQGSCKIGLNRWRSAILSIDEKVLNANLLSQLIGAIPSSEVINKLRECTEEEVKKMPEGEQVDEKLLMQFECFNIYYI